MASITRVTWARRRTTFAFPSIRQRVAEGTRGTEMLRVRAGDFQAWIDVLGDGLPRFFGGMTPPAKAP